MKIADVHGRNRGDRAKSNAITPNKRKLEAARRYSLEAMLKRVTPKSVHPEQGWGRSVGRELSVAAASLD